MIMPIVIRAVITTGLVSMAVPAALPAAHSNLQASDALQTAWDRPPGPGAHRPPATALRRPHSPSRTTPSPPASRSRTLPYPGPSILARIAWCESRNDYLSRNPDSTASGKYQVLDSTWNNYGGYARAYLAPPAIQEAWALEAFDLAGTQPWESSRACWG